MNTTATAASPEEYSRFEDMMRTSMGEDIYMEIEVGLQDGKSYDQITDAIVDMTMGVISNIDSIKEQFSDTDLFEEGFNE